MIQLRDYQEQAIAEIAGRYQQGDRGVCFLLPTGGGKTVTVASIVDRALKKDKRVLFVAHRHRLIRQAMSTFRDFGIPCGAIAGKEHHQGPAAVGMVATIANRLDRIERPDLIVFDEAHHCMASTYLKIINHFEDSKILGVTATSERLDGKGLDGVFDSLVPGPSMRDLMERGAICRYSMYVPPQRIDTSGLKKNKGDWSAKDLESRATNAITGSAVEHYSRLCPGARAIAFATSVKHAESIAEEFTRAGYPARMISGYQKAELQDQILAEFERGEIKVLTSCDLVGEGFDCPSVECAILLRPTASLTVYLQQVGRVLRPSPGKTKAVILDHAGNIRHGLPCAPRRWSLEGKAKREEDEGDLPEERVAVCDSCFASFPAHLTKCPYCQSPRVALGNQKKLEVVDGELVEITEEMETEGLLRTLPYREALAMAKTPKDIKIMARARKYSARWQIIQLQERGYSPEEACKALGFQTGILYFLGMH